MDLSAHLEPHQVVLIKGNTKKEAIEQLMDAMARDLGSVSREELADAVWKREEIMSTGIGNGLGVPHVRMEGLSQAVMAIGIHHEGIRDYESLDDEPVQVVVLIAAPQGAHETYIRLLANAAEVLKNDELRERILETKDEREIYDIFTQEAP